jgi:hypothetical protein
MMLETGIQTRAAAGDGARTGDAADISVTESSSKSIADAERH